MVIGQYWSLLP